MVKSEFANSNSTFLYKKFSNSAIKDIKASKLSYIHQKLLLIKYELRKKKLARN